MSRVNISAGSTVTEQWSEHVLYGWTFDTVESVKQAYFDTGKTEKNLEDYIEGYKRSSWYDDIEPVLSGGSVKLNLGGENDKTKIIFTDKPIGVFDFGLASQLLYRVQEFYSENLSKEFPNEFDTYELPAGVVPNYFVEKEVIGEIITFFYVHPTGKKYLLEKRQKGLTAILEKRVIATKMIDGMRIPEEPVKGVVFSSKTKKPYVKYLRRGGKVRYVEIYSLNYYTRMSSDDFYMAVRHIPVIMVCEYLERMGTLCKFYVTRTVRQGLMKPRKYDETTNAVLPLWEQYTEKKKEWDKLKNNNLPYKSWDGRIVIQPKCVKDYGQEIDKAWASMVGSRFYAKVYEAAYTKMANKEGDPPQTHAYGDPDWYETQYQEAFERYRQKQVEYVKKGIWKGKEVVEQGLIYFHDQVLNSSFENAFGAIRGALLKDSAAAAAYNNRTVGEHAFVINYNNSTSKWFELWMKISANTIKHKLDIFNTSQPRKTFEEIRRELAQIVEEMYMVVETTSEAALKAYMENWQRKMINDYKLENFKTYCMNKINEMTIYARDGVFPTPEESIEKREAEATRLRAELIAFTI
jgi:hypothetical protein